MCCKCVVVAVVVVVVVAVITVADVIYKMCTQCSFIATGGLLRRNCVVTTFLYIFIALRSQR